MDILALQQQFLIPHTRHWKKCGKYGFLFFFLKGILWLFGTWTIYAFQ